MSCLMGVSSSPAAPNWPMSLKRRVTNGSNRPMERTERYSMGTNFPLGFSRGAVEELSRLKSEPAWMLQKRLQEALVDQRSGLIVQDNATVVRTELSTELKRKGVILTDLDSALREYPELVQQYFMTTCIPVETSKYTALHAAFWSGGVFLYIPKGVDIEDPILTQIWIDSPASATFAHTLIIAD